MFAKKYQEALKFTSKNHPHELTKTGLNDINCDICGTSYGGDVIAFHCEQCDFDMCENCKKKEEAEGGAGSGIQGKYDFCEESFKSKNHEHLLKREYHEVKRMI